MLPSRENCKKSAVNRLMISMKGLHLMKYPRFVMKDLKIVLWKEVEFERLAPS